MQHKHAQSALRSPPKAELCVHAQGKASIHGHIGLHGLIAQCEACVSSTKGIRSLMMRPQAEWKGQGDDAQGNVQHTRDWSSRYQALATPPTLAAFIVQGRRMAGICAHCSSWAMARVFSCGWEGFGRGGQSQGGFKPWAGARAEASAAPKAKASAWEPP